MTTPAVVRLDSSAPDGYNVPSGVTAFRERFVPLDSALTFKEWSELPVTRLVRGALQSLVLSGPTSVASSDAAVQYGVTSGLTLALQLLTDPSIVYPELFTGVVKPEARAPLEPTYSTSAHDALDSM